MKKIIAIILCLICYSAEASNLMVVGGGVPVAAPSGLAVVNAWNAQGFGDDPISVTVSPSSGSLLVVGISYRYTATNVPDGITDNKSGGSSTYTKVSSFTDSGTDAGADIWYTPNIAAGITQIDVSVVGTSGALNSVVVYEVTGANVSPYDSVQGTTESTGASPASSNLTNTTANAIYFTVLSYYVATDTCTINASGTDGTWSIHANGSILTPSTSGMVVSMPYIVVSSASERNHVWSRGETGWYITASAIFK